MKIAKFKSYFRWIIIGFTLFFVVNTFHKYWLEIITVKIDAKGWLFLAIALIITMLAHCWSAWVWTWILKSFQVSIKFHRAIAIYLQTNLAKYLPGNIWHFYGRVMEITQAGGSLEIATFTVLLEPILMAVAAFIIALLGGSVTVNNNFYILQIIGLIVVLIGIHPRIINSVINFINRLKNKNKLVTTIGIIYYPWSSLLGELGFLLFRGTGFLLTILALISLNFQDIIPLLSAFSFAWLLGLIVPGAPGGLGIFEVTILTVLGKKMSGEIIVAIALFRLISISAEVITAGVAFLKYKPDVQ